MEFNSSGSSGQEPGLAVSSVGRSVVGDEEPGGGVFSGEAIEHLLDDGPIESHFLGPRSGQDGDGCAGGVLAGGQEVGVELFGGDFVEERVSDIFGRDATFGVPVVFERQAAEDMVDEASDLGNPPRGPCPQLWWHVVEDRDSCGVGFASDPPVEAGKVDQNDCVGRIVAKDRFGLLDEPIELAEHRHDAGEAHHGQFGQRVNQLAAGVFDQRPHLRPPEAGGDQAGAACSEFFDQPGSMFVAAGLTD